MDPAPTLTAGQFSDSFNDFISICLNKKVEDRASYSQLLEHKFLDSNMSDIAMVIASDKS